MTTTTGSWEFAVELHAFGEQGRVIRYVDVTTPLVQTAFEHGGVEGILDAIFHFGQNDFQPKPARSVSVGDILVIPGAAFGVTPGLARYVVKGIGFEKVPEGWVTPTFVHGRNPDGSPHLVGESEWRWGLPGCTGLKLRVEAALAAEGLEAR